MIVFFGNWIGASLTKKPVKYHIDRIFINIYLVASIFPDNWVKTFYYLVRRNRRMQGRNNRATRPKTFLIRVIIEGSSISEGCSIVEYCRCIILIWFLLCSCINDVYIGIYTILIWLAKWALTYICKSIWPHIESQIFRNDKHVPQNW